MIQHYRARIEVRKDISGYVAYVDLRHNGDKTSSLHLDVPLDLKMDGKVDFDFENSSYHVGGTIFEYESKKSLAGVLNQMERLAQSEIVSGFKRGFRKNIFTRIITFNAEDGRTCGIERCFGTKKSKYKMNKMPKPRKFLR